MSGHNMSGSEFDAQKFGGMEARLDRLEREVEKMAATVQELRDLLLQARGSWKLMMAIAGLATAFGAMITKAIVWWVDNIGGRGP